MKLFMQNQAIFVFCLPLLAACLNQREPGPNNNLQNAKSVKGLVLMKDIQGYGLKETSAFIGAAFEKKASVKKISGIRSRSFQTESRDIQCNIKKQPISQTHAASASTTVSVGKLGFAPITSSSLIQMPEQAEHVYYYKLGKAFAPGLYLVKSEGSAEALSFDEYISMPELLTHVVVAGEDMELKGTAFRKSEPLKITWDAASVPNSKNIMVMDIVGESSTEEVQLSCGIKESDLLSENNSTLWEIPVNYLSALPATLRGAIRVQRLHYDKSSKPEIADIEMEGSRIWITGAAISE